MKTWKSPFAKMVHDEGVKLQWGHVDEDVEEAKICVTPATGTCGFNGATSMKTWKSD